MTEEFVNLSDVLYDFAMEGESIATLEKYLKTYPQYAPQLIELFGELQKPEEEHELSEADHELIDRSYIQHFGS